jgi:hypothetical protein
MAKMAMPCPRFSGGKLSNRMACDIGWSAPPAAPCKIRERINRSRLSAAPHRADAAVKSAMQIVRNRLRPKRIPSHPVIGSTMALDTR